MNQERISLELYQFLCQHVVGSKQTVKTKRTLLAINDNLTMSNEENTIQIASGSFGEGLELRQSDLDTVYIMKHINVCEDINLVYFNPSEVYFCIQLDDKTPGYTRLRLKHSDDGDIRDLCIASAGKLYLSNILFKSMHQNHLMRKVHGPCLSDEHGFVDCAIGLHCKSWISAAFEWVRKTDETQLNNDVKTRIIEHGVLFVPIGVKGSPTQELEWRISFSVAEKLMIYSFSHTFFLCYALIKIFFYDILSNDRSCKDLLCSYFLKTIMLWLFDEIPKSKCKPENLILCFMQCLKRLIYCVNYSVCPHYFIPQNNMFARRIVGPSRDYLLSRLNNWYSKGWQILLQTEHLSGFRSTSTKLRYENILSVELTRNMLKSRTLANLNIGNQEQTYKKGMKALLHSPSSKSKALHLYCLSRNCSEICQYLPRLGNNHNKKNYKIFRTYMFYLLQNIHHDCNSGWLKMASDFYQMNHYHNALKLISHSLSKCTGDKIYLQQNTSFTNDHLLALKSFGNRSSLTCILRTLRVSFLNFCMHSSLIPKELSLEASECPFIIPPVVFVHFLSFLCYYQLHETINYKASLKMLENTISKRHFIANGLQNAGALNCLGVAFELIGNLAGAEDSYRKAISEKAPFNMAAQRLQGMHIFNHSAEFSHFFY